MILEIALGIVLAFVILALWREILGLGVILIVLAIVLIVAGLVIAGIYWFATELEFPRKDYEFSRGALDAWLIQNETTLIILALTYVALVAVYVIGHIRKVRATSGGPLVARDSPPTAKEQSAPQDSEQLLRRRLRVALEEAVSDEKARIKSTFDEGDARFRRSVKKMEPVIAALESLKAEVGEIEGLEIAPSQHGDDAEVQLKSTWHEISLTISPAFDNSGFEIKETDHSPIIEGSEKYHQCAKQEDVLKIVVSAIGKHIAAKQLSNERQK